MTDDNDAPAVKGPARELTSAGWSPSADNTRMTKTVELRSHGSVVNLAKRLLTLAAKEELPLSLQTNGRSLTVEVPAARSGKAGKRVIIAPAANRVARKLRTKDLSHYMEQQ